MQPMHLMALYGEGVYSREEMFNLFLAERDPSKVGAIHGALESRGLLRGFLAYGAEKPGARDSLVMKTMTERLRV